MNVLLSQPKSSQSGMVDATGLETASGTTIWNYDPATFCSLETFGASQLGGGEVITGEGNERTARSLGAARTANR
jgi:hypothetical protein